jgi:hypothetical protein
MNAIPRRTPSLGALILLAAVRASAEGPQGWREIDPPSTAGAAAPRVSSSSAGPLLTWLEPAANGHALRMARLGAAAWQTPVTIAAGADLLVNWADTPVVAEGGDRGLYAAWLVEIGRGYGVRMARSGDGGATWRELGWLHADRSAAEHGFVALAAEGAGVRALWLDGENAERPGGSTALRTAHVSESIRDERVLDERVCDCCSTAAARSASDLLVAYRDRSADELRDIAVGRLAGSAWLAAPAAADGWKLLGCPVNGPEIVASGAQVAVAWFTAAGNQARVQVAFSKDGGKTFGLPVRLDGGKPLGRVGVALDGDDAIVSWLEQAGENAEVRLRRVTAGGRAGEAVIVARVPATRASGVPRIVADGQRLVAAWTDPGPGGKGGQVRAGLLPLSAIPPPR